MRRLPRSLAMPMVLAAGLFGCSDDSGNGGGPTEPQVELITVQNLASQLNVISGGDPLTNDTQKSIAGLAKELGKVMASKGGLASGAPSQVPGIRDGYAQPVLEYLWTGNNRRDPILGGFEPQVFASTDGTDLLASSPPLPPLGITCVWVVENTRWGGSPDIFGPVPTEAIRFELYETDKGLPIVPLDRVGTFIDIAPRQQAEATGGPVNVVIDAALTPGNDVMSYLLAGNSDPVTGAIDLLMAGSYDAPGGDVLDFILAIDDTRASTTMRVDDLLINSSLDVSAGLRASFNVRKRNNPRQLVEYVLVLSDAFTVSSGQVFVNEVLVANMSGDRLLPTWALATEQFVEDDNLSIMYDALLFMDSTINIQFFFSHCIGADYEAACADMVQALGL